MDILDYLKGKKPRACFVTIFENYFFVLKNKENTFVFLIYFFWL